MYNHKVVEKKWQKYWLENKTFKTGTDPEKPKYYVLDMFPYPSGKACTLVTRKATPLLTSWPE